VELHGASGYLPEQFLSSGSNQRQDSYGGSAEGRARFLLDVLVAMVAEAGAGRVGLKLSPEMNFNSITDAAPEEVYTYLVDQLHGLGLVVIVQQAVAQFVQKSVEPSRLASRNPLSAAKSSKSRHVGDSADEA
jgi:2,4-dienoyl-CoA reductase-like NADH-dependent reductase (Old Yellow Enzyme family)